MCQFAETFFLGFCKEQFLVVGRAAVKKTDKNLVEVQNFFLFQFEEKLDVLRGQHRCRASIHDPFFRLCRFFKGFAFEQFDDLVIGVAPDAQRLMLPQPVDGFIGKGRIDGGVATVEDLFARQRLHMTADRLKGRKIPVDVADKEYFHMFRMRPEFLLKIMGHD